MKGKKKKERNHYKTKQITISYYFSRLETKRKKQNSSPNTCINLFKDNKHKENTWYCMLKFSLKSYSFYEGENIAVFFQFHVPPCVNFSLEMCWIGHLAILHKLECFRFPLSKYDSFSH